MTIFNLFKIYFYNSYKWNIVKDNDFVKQLYL